MAIKHKSWDSKRFSETRPILVTGSHRSGSTWVGNTLMLDPRVTYIQEPFHADCPTPGFDYRPPFWFYSAAGAPDEEVLYEAFRALFEKTARPLSNAAMKYRGARKDLGRPLKFVKNVLKTSLYRQVPLVKDPIAILSAGWLHEKFGCRVVVMLRHPLAFAGSLKKWNWQFDFGQLLAQPQLGGGWLEKFAPGMAAAQEGRADRIDRACLLWNILHARIALYRAQHPEWLYMRYEDLAAQPVEKFAEMFDYLALRYSRRTAEKIRRMTAGGNPEETDSPGFKPRDSRLSRHTWQKRLTETEIRRVTEKTREIAQQFYPDQNPGMRSESTPHSKEHTA